MKTLTLILVTIITFLASNILAAQSIAAKTKGMQKHSGYFNYYWDNSSGNIFLEISEFKKEFLFLNSISQGLGSNDIGFDRGRIGNEHVVYFDKIGPKILLVQSNYKFRAVTQNKNEQEAVGESFAKSTLWGFTVEAESAGKVLVNLTPFILSDNQYLVKYLKDIKQGHFKIDNSRSAINLERTRDFPKNSEFDALLTFTGDDPGNYIRDVSPIAESFTIYQHLSFIQLPDNHYKKRVYDPRAGFFGISYQDYATPIDEPLVKQFIARHRLEKKFPEKQKSPVKKPIIYYVDNGAPEPVRSALLEGASWWKEAFEDAGFENAFDVKILPKDVDPMDVRYNVIQWVHRATRGWSYGNAVIDPRTGEIIKGQVSLGSLRVRQDYLIATALLAPYKSDSVNNEMKQMALARLRQLAAHEVGHTLGLMHNFAASYNNRSSVMDYPHPLIKITANNTLDLSDAYDTGIGTWDKTTIKYGYSEFNNAQAEAKGLQQIINDYIAKGLKYITDADARPQGGAHPYAHLWDNGTNAADELTHILQVRKIALNNFSENVIKKGEPFSDIETALVPLYLMHRYAVEAASKLVGGLNYSYAVRGDKEMVTDFIDPNIQKRAFNVLLQTLSPENLQLNEKLLKILPPNPPGYERTRESFASQTGVTFDPLSAAEAAIDITLQQIFNSERIARVIQYHERNNSNPDIKDLLKTYFKTVIDVDFQNGLKGEIQRLVQRESINYLIKLDMNTDSPGYVKSWAYHTLSSWREWFVRQASELTDKTSVKNHYIYLRSIIDDYFKNPKEYKLNKPVTIPPGSPIGTGFLHDYNL